MTLPGSKSCHLLPCLTSQGGVVIVFDKPANSENSEARLWIGRFGSVEVLSQVMNGSFETSGLGADRELTDVSVKSFRAIPGCRICNLGPPVKRFRCKPLLIPGKVIC